jgi:hypothetical protein
MKSIGKILISAFAVILFLSSCSTSKKSADGQKSLVINYSFENIEEGYDHLSKLMVYIDGELIAESKPVLESKPSSLTCKVLPGKHKIRIVSMAQYEGNWEEHTIENEYSIDCLLEKTIVIQNDMKITLVFDLNSGTIEK